MRFLQLTVESAGFSLHLGQLGFQLLDSLDGAFYGAGIKRYRRRTGDAKGEFVKALRFRRVGCNTLAIFIQLGEVDLRH